MADILIRSMSMPEDCSKCVVKYFTSCYEEKHLCPLTELPPHGRMIDADAFISRLEHCEEIVSMLRVSIDIKEIYFSLIGEMKEEIENVPTIIPADKDGEA